VLPVDILVWVEKTSPLIESEIEPVCERYGVDGRLGRGMPPNTLAGHLARNAATTRRELVLIVLSDADLAGQAMPAALARSLEAVGRLGLIEDVPRFRVVPAVFTMEKVAEIERALGREIPRTADSSKDRVVRSLAERDIHQGRCDPRPPVRRAGGVGVIGHPVAKTAVVAKAVSPGPSPVAKTAVVAAAVTPGRGRRRI
jgi:hypothetical protein